MDRKSVIILVVCGLLFLLWAQLTPKLYPPKPVIRTNVVAVATNGNASAPEAAAPAAATPSVPFVAPTPGAPEELLVVSNATARYTFTSHGGGLKLVELLKYPDSVARGSKQGAASSRVAALNAQASMPVLALTGSEALAGDGVFKLSKFSGNWPDGTNNKTRAVTGVRAEKLLGNGLFLVKEFVLASNYLVNVRVRFENQSGQPLALPPQQWIVGNATPLNAQDDEQSVGFHWWNGTSEGIACVCTDEAVGAVSFFGLLVLVAVVMTFDPLK